MRSYVACVEFYSLAKSAYWLHYSVKQTQTQLESKRMRLHEIKTLVEFGFGFGD